MTDPADLAGAVRAARSEAGAAFGDAAVYLERRLARPRHIEVQLLGDAHGTVLPFVERECSIQRRHQKVVEETPSLAVTPALREAMTAAAAAVAQRRRLHQRRHHRVPARRRRPLLLPRDEHAAAGRASDHRDGDRRRSRPAGRSASRAASGSTSIPRRAAGAERPRDRVPDLRRGSGQQLPAVAGAHPRSFASPAGPGIRDDSGATAGLDVPIFYDPMISKLVAWAEDRPRAIARMRRALGEYRRRRHQDDAAVFHVAARAAGVRRRAVPHHLSRRGADGAQRQAVRRADAGGRGDGRDRRGAAGGAVAVRPAEAAGNGARRRRRAGAARRLRRVSKGCASAVDEPRLRPAKDCPATDAVRDRGRRAPAARRGDTDGRQFCSQPSTDAPGTLTRRGSTRTRCR